jgi:hypothetical protein
MSHDLDSKFARLAASTEPLAPAPGFNERVLAAVGADRAPNFGAGVVRFGRAMLAVAALSAVLGVTFGLLSERAADEALATTIGIEDVAW